VKIIMLKHTLAAFTLVAALPVYADDFNCTTSVGAKTIDGNVIVPSGRSCTLTGTYVKGNVELEDNAKVVVRGGATVIGNVQTDGAARVRIRDSEIDGDVQITGVDSAEQSLVLNSTIGGTVDWNDSSAPFLIRFSDVDSDVKVNQNAALARVFDNVIDGNLQCQSNEPAPKGARNRVGGNKEDQCKRF
jgi:hypothetical protein